MNDNRFMQSKDTKKPGILICPLDWGLGHAARCIPVIHQLTKAGARVVIGAGGAGLELLRAEFPGLEFILMPGYNISYSRRFPLGIILLLQVPRILFHIIMEHRSIGHLVRKHDIRIVISDNRYGLWTKHAYCVFITHQVNIIPPPFLNFTESLLARFVRFILKRYREVWIPDAVGIYNLSGRLSHGKDLSPNVKFTGPLSRFELTEPSDEPMQNYDILAVISGPEPQRSAFEETLLRLLPDTNCKCLIVRGIPGHTKIQIVNTGIHITGHLPAAVLGAILKNNPLVISRSGYSTIMDLAFTGNKAVLVATPGQTEQEYLARRMDDLNLFACWDGKDDSFSDALKKSRQYSGIVPGSIPSECSETCKELLKTTGIPL